MATNCKCCFLCAHYDSYYVKGTYSFYKKSHGDCTKNHCMVNNNDSCENWKSSREVNKLSKQIKLRKLEKLAESLSELIIILKDDLKENNT